MSVNLRSNSREAASLGSRMVIKDRVTDEPLGTEDERPVLILAGIDSDQWRKAELEQTDRQLLKARRGRNSALSAEELDAGELNKLVAITLGWEHVNYDGEETFSSSVIRKMYVAEPWLRRQVQRHIADDANFLGNSPTN